MMNSGIYIVYIAVLTNQSPHFRFRAYCHTPTPQLLLNHTIRQLEFCPSIQFADCTVWKDRNIGNMAFSIIVDGICRNYNNV